MKYKYLECDCVMPEHLLRFIVDDEYNTVYVSIHINKMPIYYRILYLLGKRQKGGMFEETIINKDRFIKFLEELKE